jgi:hypothetical protein
MEDDVLLKEKEYRAQMDQMRISYNEKTVIKAGNKRVTVYPLVGAALDYMSKYYTQQKSIEDKNTAGLIVALIPNLKLQYKALSIAILNNPNWIVGWLKIKLFHGIHWRILRWKYNTLEMQDITVYAIEKMGLGFFFQSTVLTSGINTLKKKSQEVESSEAKQE